MSIQGNNNKYTDFTTSVDNFYTQTRQGAVETYERLKHSLLASESTKTIPQKDMNTPASTPLKEAWPTRLTNATLTTGGALYKSLSSRTSRIKQNVSRLMPIRKPTAENTSTKADPALSLSLAKIKKEAADLNDQQIFADLRSGVSCSSLVDKHGILQINEKMEDLISILESKRNFGSIGGDEVLKLKAQLKNIREISVNAQAMHDDHYSLDYINDIAVFRLKMREGDNPLSSQFPTQLTLADSKTGVMVDQNNKPFGGIRDKGGLTEKFFNFCDAQGGDSRIIKNWMSAQGGLSYSGESNIIKYELFLLRGGHGEENYWSGSVDDDGVVHEYPIKSSGDVMGLDHALLSSNTLEMEPFKGDLGEVRTKIRTSLAAWTAYNLEFYRHTSLEGVNKDNQTQLLVRTESPKGIRANGISLSKTLAGNYKVNTKDEFQMKRGIYESASREAPVFAAGTAGRIVTVQEVPLHRCIYTYQLHQLKSDDEMEVGFIADGIKFNFLPDKQAPSLFKQLKNKLK